MANVTLTVTLNQALPGGNYSVITGSQASPVGSPPSTATVAADVATLVADGALPTQAHVNTLNTDWGTFLTAETTYRGGASALTANFTLVYDAATVTNMNQVRAALRALEQVIAGRGLTD